MKSWLAVIILFILNNIVLFFSPFWSSFVVGFLLFLFFIKNINKAFILGFVAGFLAWLLLILIKDIPNEHILSEKIAAIFHLPNYLLLIIINSCIGGITCGLGAWLGNTTRKFLFQ